MRISVKSIILVFLMLALSLSVATNSLNKNIEVKEFEEYLEPLNVILPLSDLNEPGFQEGSIYTNATLSSGDSHTCAILNNGSVSCWGQNWGGQLGDGTTTDQNTPTPTSSLGTERTAVAISSGSSHTCAILDDGSVSCWGFNGYGQLGNGTTTNSYTPTQTLSLGTGRTAVVISSGRAHTCAILDDGTVSCWGYNVNGQLGDGTTIDRNTPTQTSTLGVNRTAVAISSEGSHTCALLDDGSASCWGNNGDYQLGDGNLGTNRHTPTQTWSLGIGRTAVAISSGLSHTCAVLDDGSISCWGGGQVGQLGTGTTTALNTPTQTSSLGTGRTAVAISSGGSHTCALLDNGSVSCWGGNWNDQIGDGTTTNRNTPTQTSSLGTGRTAVAISSGNDHTCALLDDASVSCWGYNEYGQLGDGMTMNRNTPTQTSSIGPIPTVAVSERDLDGDDVLNIFDAFPNDPDKSVELGDGNSGSDQNNSGNGNEPCQLVIDRDLVTSRTCSIPQGDMDWDGLPDEPTSETGADEDRDGDGKMDLIELSDSIVGTDIDTMDMGIISSPDLNFVHSITATTETTQIEIVIEYKMTITEMMVVLPLIAYTYENGTPNDMTDFNLNSAIELDRLEQQMCSSPKSMLLDGAQSIPHWLENFSIDGHNAPFNWECEWEERRSIDLMYDFMMISDASEIANWKETVRYTLILDTFDVTSENTIIHLPISNGTTGKVWELKVVTTSSEQSLIYHPWIEKGTLVAPNPVVDQTSQDDTSSPAIPAVTPSYTSAWSIIVDVKEGSVDCSGYSDSVNEAGSWDDFDSMYNQNDIDYSSLSSYHEYSNSDDNIYLSCSGNVNFDQAMDGLEDDFCAYLFLYGELKQSKCDSGSSTSVILSGQKTTLQEDLDDFEQDLADLENQWQNDLDDLFDTGDSSDSSDFGAEMDDLIDTVFFPMALLILVIASISALVKKQQQLKDKRESKEENDDYESFTNQFRTQKNQSNSTFSERSNEKVWSDDTEMTWSEEPEKPTFEYVEETEGIKSPNFDFQGEVNEDGWEVCEYPRSSGVWWWKDYESQSWLIWE